MIKEEKRNTFNTDNKIICPYCGCEEEVDFETFSSSSAECDQEMECSECGKTFLASRRSQFSYETCKMEEEEVK